MKKSCLVGLGFAVLMAGCVAQPGPRGGPTNPEIMVSAGQVQRVVPDPIEFDLKKGRGAVVIHWDAPDGHLFVGRGIVIDGEVEKIGGPITNREQTEIMNCHVTGNRKQVQCTNARSRKGVFKYTVLLEAGGQPLKPFDPNIVNKE